MVAIWSDMTWTWYEQRCRENQLGLGIFVRGGEGMSRAMSSTRVTFCRCSECELASQIWGRCAPTSRCSRCLRYGATMRLHQVGRYSKQEVHASQRIQANVAHVIKKVHFLEPFPKVHSMKWTFRHWNKLKLLPLHLDKIKCFKFSKEAKKGARQTVLELPS